MVYFLQAIMNSYCCLLVIITCFTMETCGSRVLELSDRFTEIRKEGYWLVKFYAPWCGHCKRLEPIWAHVAQALYKTNVRVGRVDCTRFPSIGAEFEVAGYPTIKFIKPDGDVTFRGDRTKEDIVNFAVRMSGPAVQDVTRSESLTNIKNMNQLFFMYVGNQEGPLWDTFYEAAIKLQPHGFFYSATEQIAKQHVDIDELPAVFVYKESLHYFYSVDTGTAEEKEEHLNTSLYRWINEERFETFPKITRANINEILQTNKYIVFVIVEENKLQQVPPEMLEFRDMVESLIRKKRDKYHKHFQFGWVGSPELANSIALQVVPIPYLIVLNSTTYHHHVPEDDPTEMTAEAIDVFLEGIRNQTVTAYGGSGIAVRFYRTYFEATTALVDMWQGNPVLTIVLFGLPFSFLSFILYSICCADILDADEEEEGPVDPHEKKE